MKLLQRILSTSSICCLALILLQPSVDALNLFRRAAEVSSGCVECKQATTSSCTLPCNEEEICVLIPRTCQSCQTSKCQSLKRTYVGAAEMNAIGEDHPMEVKSSSSGPTFLILGICGAGVAGLLAAGLFVLREKNAQKVELENQRRQDSYLASDKSSSKRAATAITSVECDFGVEKHVERQNEILALQEQIMYGNPSDIAASITKGPAAVPAREVNTPDKTPLLPAPSLYFSNRTHDSDHNEFDLNEVEKEEAKEDVDALPSLTSPISAAYRRTSRVQKSFSTHSAISNFQFPNVPTSTPINSSSELRDSFGFGLPDIPSSASIKGERLSGRRRSLADVSSKTLSQTSLQIKTSFSPGFAPAKRLSPVGNFQLMRSQSGHNRTVSDALGNSGDRLSSVGTNSFSRVASTFQPPAISNRSVGSLHSRTSSLGSISKGGIDIPTDLEETILKRPKSERERRRESMVREAMKRASVEHVLVTPPQSSGNYI